MATHSLSILVTFPVISVIFRQYSSSRWMPNVSQSTTLAGVGVEFPTKHRMTLPENIFSNYTLGNFSNFQAWGPGP